MTPSATTKINLTFCFSIALTCVDGYANLSVLTARVLMVTARVLMITARVLMDIHVLVTQIWGTGNTQTSSDTGVRTITCRW
jgi:hypothetical protein